jgi:hypothetical protein
MNISNIPLFPTNLFVHKVDPILFNKSEIIETVIRNYEIKKERNEWDGSAKMHHYYNDWNNELFEKIDLEKITEHYKLVYQDILNRMFDKPIEFRVHMENITVHKGKDTFMDSHNHVGPNIFFSGVHYIKCDETSAALTFVNPLIYSEYPNQPTQTVTNDSIDKGSTLNSSYFKEWNYSISEDEMLVFPSYLNHRVLPSKFEDSDFRIAIVTNLHIYSAKYEQEEKDA